MISNKTRETARGITLLAALAAAWLFFPEAKASSNRVTPTVRAVAAVLPSVVNISTERVVRRWSGADWAHGLFEEFQDRYQGLGSAEERFSLGSGVFIASEGLILTNYHVVSRASKIHITTTAGLKLAAEELAGDQENDLALLRIIDMPENAAFKAIPFAAPDDLYLAEPVIAVGNPFGLGNSVSSGVLSAINRKLYSDGQVVFSDLLQTDAAINPGNSGGPLINIDGEMIGVSTIIVGEAQGIGFAIPLKRALNVLARWLIPERFQDVSLGLVPGFEAGPEGREVVMIADVLPESPAARAGLRRGQIIRAVDGKPLHRLIALSERLWKFQVGDVLTLELADGRDIRLVAEKVPEMDGRELAGRRLGIELRPLTPQLAEAMGYPFYKGLVVSDSRAQSQDIQRGEILAMLNDVRVYGYPDIARALQDRRHGDQIIATLFKVITRDGRRYLVRQRTALQVL